MITANTATVDGGGVSNSGSLIHCTLTDNSPNALRVVGSSSIAALGNALVWSNGAQPVRVGAGNALTVNYTDLQGGLAAAVVDPNGTLTWGVGNRNAAPRLDMLRSGRLMAASPCIDAGANLGLTEDLDGVPRPLGNGFDIGAYERDPGLASLVAAPAALRFRAVEGLAEAPPAQSIALATDGTALTWTASVDSPWLNVTPAGGQASIEARTLVVSVGAGLPAGEYAAWITVDSPAASNLRRRIPVVLSVSPQRTVCPDGSGNHTTIQAAINAALPGEAIVVCPGIYNENIRFNNKRIILRSTAPQDPAVVGATVINGRDAGAVVTFSGSETPDTILTGFTLTNGRAANGGGIRGRDSGSATPGTLATISFCVVRDNETSGTTGTGGGVWNCGGLVSDCTIEDNRAQDGAGFHLCTGTITRCTVRRNTATRYGGGFYACTAQIAACLVTLNAATVAGGGLAQCDQRISDCVISGNAGGGAGGGLFECAAVASGCTILGNKPNGIHRSNGASVLQGSIVRLNRPSQILPLAGGQVSASFCDVAGGFPGAGNIDLDPAFASPGYWDDSGTPGDPNDDVWVDGDYRLSAGSPCVNAGALDSVWALQALDIAGAPRMQQCRVDMGAYESPFFIDCNGSGTSDSCDITVASSPDLNGNGTPDECDDSDTVSPPGPTGIQPLQHPRSPRNTATPSP